MSSDSDERQKYHSFWDQFSGRADNSAMMLNANADQIEAFDRENILALLPSVKNKFVVDIGAGIGRFTTIFAQADALKVVATDFVQSFVDKNRERNCQYANVEWRVCDATGLKFDESSVDFVFTNWLLMYMSDEEAVQFVANALKWLRSDGFLHLRESCSEPSTKKISKDDNNSNNNSAAVSLHSKSNPNPTRYRLSSAYIQLLRSIRHTDEKSGKQWRFDVRWACSVDVYIERQLNWRQVHWLAKKVPVKDNDDAIISMPKIVGTLVSQFAEQWPAEQRELDHRMDAIQKAEWIQRAMDKCLDGIELKEGGDGIVFSFSGRKIFQEFGFDAQTLAKRLDRKIWAVETDPFAYRNGLTRANQCADRRIRLAWHPNLECALDLWAEVDGQRRVQMFDAIVGTEIMAQLQDAQTLNKFVHMLQNGTHFACVELLEPDKSYAYANKILKANLDLLRSQFIVVDEEMEQLENGYHLLVVHAKVKHSSTSDNSENGMQKNQQRQLLMGGF